MDDKESRDCSIWKWTLVLAWFALVALMSSEDVLANSQYSNYTFPSQVVSLHVLKNDDTKTHEVYLCRNLRVCYKLYLGTVSKTEHTAVWIEKLDGSKLLLGRGN
jgi:hypothetical protein